MSHFRSLFKPLLPLFLTFCAVSGSLRLANQVNQYFLRRRAEPLLTVIRSIELRRTTWDSAETELLPWRTESRNYEPYDEDERYVQITLDDAVTGYLEKAIWMIRVDDYLRWRLKLSYDEGPAVRLAEFLLSGYMRMGGRLAQVKAGLRMRDGVVWNKDFLVHIEEIVPPFTSPEADCDMDCTIALIGGAASSAQFPTEDRYRPQLLLHPTYVFDGPDGGTGWFGGLIAASVVFSPDANPADINRLMQFNLYCLTRWYPCYSKSDIMPTAWKQHLAEMALR